MQGPAQGPNHQAANSMHIQNVNPREALSAVLLVMAGAMAPASQAAPADTRRAAAWFDAARDRSPLVRQFLQRMPKGADLHSHLSGAVYAESYIDWAAQAGGCLDTARLALVAAPCTEGEGRQRLSNLPTATYNALIDRMSTRNLSLSGKTGHDQFFDAFAVFGPAADLPGRKATMVAELTDRASAQHTRHLELMITLQGRAVRQLGSTESWPGNGADSTEFARRRQWLLDHGLPDLVAQSRRELDLLDQDRLQTQACGTAQARPGCAVSVRWLQQITRTAPPEQHSELNLAVGYDEPLSTESPAAVSERRARSADLPLLAQRTTGVVAAKDPRECEIIRPLKRIRSVPSLFERKRWLQTT